MKTTTQREQIKADLMRGRAITPMDALQMYGCFRLGARICELRKEGLKIETEPYKTMNGSVVAKYFMK